MKNFDAWNRQKKKTDGKSNTPSVRIGDIFWTHCGINIGTETNGAKDSFLRPVVVRVFNQNHVLVIPATKTKKKHDFYYPVTIDNIESSLSLTQVRVMSAKRFVKRIERLKKHEVEQILQQLQNILAINYPAKAGRGLKEA